jgi:hypothetical protein
MTESTVILDSPESIRQHLRRDIGRHEFDDPGVRFVLCDDRNEVRAHVHVGDTPPEVDLAASRRVVALMADGLTSAGDDGAMLLAVMRAGAPTLAPSDAVWFRVARAVCADRGVRLLGVHVLTPHGQREVNLDDAL